MKSPQKTLKLVLAGMLAVPLAALSGAHGLSSASLRNAPELSVAVFPFNGLALEKLAYRRFVDGVEDTLAGSDDGNSEDDDASIDLMERFEVGNLDLQAFAQRASQVAKDGLTLEPLLPQAHAVLALSATDPQNKRQLVTSASRLNRRELALQGLVLEQRIDEGDYAGTINTLDQILRVHPARKAEFFPLLINAIAESETKQTFINLLGEQLPWRDAFLDTAVGEPRVLENLADIRQQITLDNAGFDQKLIAGLARQGSLGPAARMYRLVATSEQAQAPETGKVWLSTYPPFDWKLADTAGMRAQPSKDLGALELAIEPGNGGTLASRIVPTPKAPFEIRIAHEITPESQVKDFKLELSCWGQATVFFAQEFSNNTSLFKIENTPACDFIELALVARAWTDAKPLNARLMPVQISSR